MKFLQHPKSLVAKPGFISELKGMAMKFRARKGREKNTEFLQPLLLEFKSWGELPEHHTQFLFEGRSMVEKEGEGFSAILQTFDMGNESTPFHGEDKLFGCPFIPGFKDLFLREAIKGHIQLDRAKVFGVKFKPLSLGKGRRIKDPIPPMRIVIATGTNVKSF